MKQYQQEIEILFAQDKLFSFPAGEKYKLKYPQTEDSTFTWAKFLAIVMESSRYCFPLNQNIYIDFKHYTLVNFIFSHK